LAARERTEQWQEAAELYRQGLSCTAIGKRIGLCGNTVRDMLIDHGVMAAPDMRTGKEAWRERCSEAIHLHEKEHMRTIEIADLMGTTEDTIYRWWKFAGYNPGEDEQEERARRNEKIEAMFISGMTIRAIAKELSIPPGTVHSACVALGLVESRSTARLGYPSAADVKSGKVPDRHLCPRCAIICHGDDPTALCEYCAKERERTRRPDALAAFDADWLSRNLRRSNEVPNDAENQSRGAQAWAHANGDQPIRLDRDGIRSHARRGRGAPDRYQGAEDPPHDGEWDPIGAEDQIAEDDALCLIRDDFDPDYDMPPMGLQDLDELPFSEPPLDDDEDWDV